MNAAMLDKVFQEFLGAPEGFGQTYAQLAGSTDTRDRQLAQYLAKPRNMRSPREQQLVDLFQKGGLGAVRQYQNKNVFRQYSMAKGKGFLPKPETSALGVESGGVRTAPPPGPPGMFDQGLTGGAMTDVISPQALAQQRAFGFQDVQRQMGNEMARSGVSGSSAGLQAMNTAKLMNLMQGQQERVQAKQMNRQALTDAQGLLDSYIGNYSGFGRQV